MTAAPDAATVHLDVPADASYAMLIRAALAALAAQADFTLDRIEDLRLAGTEAFSLAVLRAPADATVRVTATSDSGGITVTTTAPVRPDATELGGPGGLGWTLLKALVDELTDDTTPASTSIALQVARVAATPAGSDATT